MVVKESKYFGEFPSVLFSRFNAERCKQSSTRSVWGGAALQVRCFRRVNSGTAGVKRWHPISAAEFQQEDPEKSALEKCVALSEGEPFAGGVSGEVGSELPISPPSPPMKHNCPAGTLNLESAARKASSKIPKIPRGGDSESPIAEGFTTR